MTVCCVRGCKNRILKNVSESVKFFALPSERIRYKKAVNAQLFKRRCAWLKNSNQKFLDDYATPRFCSAHFQGGAPCRDAFDESHPDWAPTIFPSTVTLNKSDVRSERAKKREECRVSTMHRNSIGCTTQDSTPPYSTFLDPAIQESFSQDGDDTGTSFHTTNLLSSTAIDMDFEEKSDKIAELEKRIEELELANNQLKETSERTNNELEMSIQLNDELALKYITTSEKLFNVTQEKPSLLSQLQRSEEMTRYYTGLNSYELFDAIFESISPALNPSTLFKISLKEQFLMTMMKLRLNLATTDLAYRFTVSRTTACKYIDKFITFMAVRLPPVLLRWPNKEASEFTMPLPFKTNFPKCTCILDCFEVNCEMHGWLLAKISLYSKYKSHHTGKFLIVITPQGSICFVSKDYGGRVTDVEIVRDSGLLKHVKSGDLLMADRGFLIEEDLAQIGASLAMPAFKGTRAQLEGEETERSRIVANVRIHVERVIGNLRKKFMILRGPIKVRDMCTDPHDETFIDKIVTVCCCLHNAMPSIVPPV